MGNIGSETPQHEVVPREQWLAARIALLAEEKQLTRQQERIAAARRALPWVKIDKEYWFDTDQGKLSLADLFAGRHQLIVKHNMLSPELDICVGCSFETDHIEGALVHLEQRDTTFVMVSRAPLEKIQAARRRMGWSCRWVSSCDSDFNYDFNVSFPPQDLAGGPVTYNYREQRLPLQDLSGFSVFYRDDDGDVFHTYSAYSRGAEYVMTTYVLLDMTPKGRDETGRGNLTDWARPHDSYGKGGTVTRVGQYVPPQSECGCRE